MVPLAYADGDLHFNSLALLLPVLTVKSYEPHTGRLALSFQGASDVFTKLHSLQESILSAVRNQQDTWFSSGGGRQKETESVREGFQPMLDRSTLYLYCPQGTEGAGTLHDISIYSKGVWTKGRVPPSLLTTGARVRIALRIQGISFQMNGGWTGKFRLQHRILAVLSAVA